MLFYFYSFSFFIRVYLLCSFSSHSFYVLISFFPCSFVLDLIQSSVLLCLTLFLTRHTHPSMLTQAQYYSFSKVQVTRWVSLYVCKVRQAEWHKFCGHALFVLLLFHLPEATTPPLSVTSQKHHCGTAGRFHFLFLLRVLHCPYRVCSWGTACLSLLEKQSIMACHSLSS